MEALTNSRDSVLDMLGLQVRHSQMDVAGPALALFGVGFLVGAGIAVLFAPESGADLRGDIARRLSPSAS